MQMIQSLFSPDQNCIYFNQLCTLLLQNRETRPYLLLSTLTSHSLPVFFNTQYLTRHFSRLLILSVFCQEIAKKTTYKSLSIIIFQFLLDPITVLHHPYQGIVMGFVPGHKKCSGSQNLYMGWSARHHTGE